jgi:hypothetical protein
MREYHAPNAWDSPPSQTACLPAVQRYVPVGSGASSPLRDMPGSARDHAHAGPMNIRYRGTEEL